MTVCKLRCFQSKYQSKMKQDICVIYRLGGPDMDRIDKHIEHRIDNVYGKFKGRAAGPLLRIFQWRSQLQKGTSGRKGKVENSTVLEVGCPPPENFRIFELPILDFLQFQHDFHSFSDKKGLLLEGGGGGGGGRGLWLLLYIC